MFLGLTTRVLKSPGGICFKKKIIQIFRTHIVFRTRSASPKTNSLRTRNANPKKSRRLFRTRIYVSVLKMCPKNVILE